MTHKVGYMDPKFSQPPTPPSISSTLTADQDYRVVNVHPEQVTHLSRYPCNCHNFQTWVRVFTDAFIESVHCISFIWKFGNLYGIVQGCYVGWLSPAMNWNYGCSLQVTKDFELYAALEPLVTKQNAIVYINKLLRWIKSDENRLFILSSPTF